LNTRDGGLAGSALQGIDDLLQLLRVKRAWSSASAAASLSSSEAGHRPLACQSAPVIATRVSNKIVDDRWSTLARYFLLPTITCFPAPRKRRHFSVGCRLMAYRPLLSADQWASLLAAPADEQSLIRHCTLSGVDLDLILSKRGHRNQLGFAAQLCLMRFPGRALTLNETPCRTRGGLHPHLDKPFHDRRERCHVARDRSHGHGLLSLNPIPLRDLARVAVLQELPVLAAEPFIESELELPLLAQEIRAGGDLLRARCAGAQCRREFGVRQPDASSRSSLPIFPAALHIASNRMIGEHQIGSITSNASGPASASMRSRDGRFSQRDTSPRSSPNS